MTAEISRRRPKTQGPNGPNAEQPLKIDLPFEEAVKRVLRAGKPAEPPKRRDGREPGGKGEPRARS
jgi:hypothetical protein